MTGADPPAEPARWVIVGWRSARGVTLTREQLRAVWNTPDGPCARCRARHRRYGSGGSPLCTNCRPAPKDQP